jgi:uncharacterized membrane protein (Fun14 family)
VRLTGWVQTVVRMGFGGVLGVCVGMAAKQVTSLCPKPQRQRGRASASPLPLALHCTQVTRATLTAVGLQFLVLQLMASHGLVDIKWEQIKSSLAQLLGVEPGGVLRPHDLNVRRETPRASLCTCRGAGGGERQRRTK